jgi:putative intracellular protease/amidase
MRETMTSTYRNQKKSKAQTYILIGDGFDEFEVIYFLHKFRQAGLPIKSVSLFGKLVVSRQGVGIKADCALSERPFDPMDECLFVLPSGGRNGDVLRQDARVKSLLQTVNQGKGSVAVTDSHSHLAGDVEQLLTLRPTYHPSSGQNLEEFVETLASRVEFAT